MKSHGVATATTTISNRNSDVAAHVLTHVISAAVLILVSVSMRRWCMGPGGLVHRHVKSRIRQDTNATIGKELVEIMISGTADSTSSKNRYQQQRETNENVQFQKVLRQYSGLLVLIMATVTCLLWWFCFVSTPKSSSSSNISSSNTGVLGSGGEIMVVVALMILANALDEWVPKWEQQKHDVLDLRQQLQQSFLPSQSATNEDGNDSDSSESYDPEKQKQDNMTIIHHRHQGNACKNC